MPSEIFAILCQLTEGPSIQTIDIIRYVVASFDIKKYHWDYHFDSYNIDIPCIFSDTPNRFTIIPREVFLAVGPGQIGREPNVLL